MEYFFNEQNSHFAPNFESTLRHYLEFIKGQNILFQIVRARSFLRKGEFRISGGSRWRSDEKGKDKKGRARTGTVDGKLP